MQRIELNLGRFAGEEIKIRFGHGQASDVSLSYWSSSSTADTEGWFFNNIELPGVTELLPDKIVATETAPRFSVRFDQGGTWWVRAIQRTLPISRARSRHSSDWGKAHGEIGRNSSPVVCIAPALGHSCDVDDPRIYDLERQKRTPPRAPITFSLEHPLLRIIFSIYEDKLSPPRRSNPPPALHREPGRPASWNL
jgi:hypothetical protein